jgi:SAM-dependent methyltransferase
MSMADGNHGVPSSWRELRGVALPDWFPAPAVLQRFFAGLVPAYRWRRPEYPMRMLADLARLIPAEGRRVLDIGAGTGVVAEAIENYFPEREVVAVDVVGRYLDGLSVRRLVYGGTHLPFPDGAFDVALFCNVLHHVPPERRPALLEEALRVTGGGPLVIKDHLAEGVWANARLWMLDAIGNLPFGGMVSAEYLGWAQWRHLFEAHRLQVASLTGSPYRRGFMAILFPNRLEISFVVSRAAGAGGDHARSPS